MTKRYLIQPDNEFHEGWLDYLFGLDRPAEGDAKQDGWDMASETPPVQVVRAVFKPRVAAGVHFTIEVKP